MKKLFILLSLIPCSLSLLFAQTGKWTAVKNKAPHANMGVCLLMTDGTVICHNTSGGGEGTGWDRLTPDSNGSYVNGTWDSIPNMAYDRLFFSSQVLPNGKVYVAGGEYGAGGVNGEVYDPVAKTWTTCGPIPNGWSNYDGNSELLYDGTVLEGPQISDTSSDNNLIWSPVTNNYTLTRNSLNHDEAQWQKLRDSTVLFIGINSDSSNRYFPKIKAWRRDAAVPVFIWDGLEEAGPGLMLPNGKNIFFGATPANVIYTPSGNANPGTWTVADSFPVIQGMPMGMSDAPAAMMVNGKILCAVAPSTSSFAPPTYFVEYDYLTNTFTQITDTIPGMNGNDSIPIPSYENQMLDLPDGTVLLSISQNSSSYSKSYLIYTPSGSPIPQGKPTINNITETSCGIFRITGKLFNGISEGAAYGDDWQMETNYPIVRVQKGNRVYYATTSNWNRIGALLTDSLEDTAYFTFPNAIPGGTYSLTIVANGFPSNPTLFTTFGFSVSVQNLNCVHPTGSASVSASNGTSPYTYLWEPGGTTTDTITGLSVGTYTVIVTEAGGCSASTTVTVTQPLVSINAAITNVACHGGSNGSASVTVSGGTNPYTYLWQGGATTSSVTGLSNGTYSLTVTDSCGLNTTASVTITQPGVFGLFSVTNTNLHCYAYSNAQATITADSGSMPYTYLWQNGNTSATASGLSSGTYSVVVQDACGGTVTASVTITAPPAMSGTIDTLSASSSTACDGKAWVTSSGGTPPYTYLWTTGGQTTDTIMSQCSGNYCCVVTDNSGCDYPLCIDIGVTGIANISSGDDPVSVYPNPSNGIFTIAGAQNLAPANVEVYNVLGEKVYSQSNIPVRTGTGGQNPTFNIDLRSKSNGIYFYRVLNEQGTIEGQGKIVIDR